VAEEHVRRAFDVTGLDDLQVTASAADWLVSHQDARTWTVRVTAYEDGERPESCGKVSKPVTRRNATVVAAP
jgi:hypothetical protein